MQLYLRRWFIMGVFIFYYWIHIKNNISVPATVLKDFSSSDSIKIISYNIHYGISPKGHPKLKDIASFLNSSNADIICLQEVDDLSFRSYFQKQPDYFKKNLSMEYYYTPTNKIITGQTGSIILSRFPILSSEEHILPSDQYIRKIQKVIVATPLGDMAVFNTHLGLSKPIREEQILLITKLIEETSLPFILAGDMNTSNLEEFKSFSSLATDTGSYMEKSGISAFKNLKYDCRIDYIFVSNNFDIRNYDVSSLYPSDHEPVMVEIKDL